VSESNGAKDVLARVDWVEVPAGTVAMGTDEDALDTIMAGLQGIGVDPVWLRKECPRRTVTVGRFLAARNLVTNEMFAAGAAELDLAWQALGPADHPAVVSWAQADAFCRWLTDNGGSPVRLPTEEEWERAARGHDAREYPWGDEFATDRANVQETGIGATTPVGSFPKGASPFGLLDMGGNVEEWTSTRYAPYPGAAPDVVAAETHSHDPHVSRGGSYQKCRDLSRCARRHSMYELDAAIGIRLVCHVDT
jgi:toxoflavin biosynthesis protein ToxD